MSVYVQIAAAVCALVFIAWASRYYLNKEDEHRQKIQQSTEDLRNTNSSLVVYYYCNGCSSKTAIINSGEEESEYECSSCGAPADKIDVGIEEEDNDNA